MNAYSLEAAIKKMIQTKEVAKVAAERFYEAQEAAWDIWRKIGPFDVMVVMGRGFAVKHCLKFGDANANAASFVRIDEIKSLNEMELVPGLYPEDSEAPASPSTASATPCDEAAQEQF